MEGTGVAGENPPAESGRTELALRGKVLKQTPEVNQIFPAGTVGQRRVPLFPEATKPAEQVGISAQFRKCAQLREILLDIGEKTTGTTAIVAYGGRPQSGCERLNTSLEDLQQ